MSTLSKRSTTGAGRIFATAIASILAACAVPGAHEAAPSADRYRALLESPVRTERDHKMDAGRHPVELLQFAGVRPGMHVLDVATGAGYTSQLLALAVGPSGKVWAQAPKPGDALKERMAAHPQANYVVVTRPFDDPVPPGAGPLDLVTLVLNYHDISYLPVDRDAMNRKLFAALKPGGHYVVVDHSAVAGSGISAGKTLHRIDEAFLTAEVEKAGFRLEKKGDFMRSAADTREASSNQPTPPSDKFVLDFVKPH